MDRASETAPKARQVDHVSIIAKELALEPRQVEAVLGLLAEGGTVPFIARYRKERTGALDEVQIRTIQERSEYLKELDERRASILEEIKKQDKLTPELEARIQKTLSKAELEDLYLPFKPKRRTRATIAKERGLEPLADAIWAQGDAAVDPTPYVDPAKEVLNADQAWAGARDIVAERLSEDASLRSIARQLTLGEGDVVTKVTDEKATEKSKFENYYDHKEKLSNIPSHRYLAIRRGEKEGYLRVSIEAPVEKILERLKRAVVTNAKSPTAHELEKAIADAYGRLIAPSIENEIREELKEKSDEVAIDVFAANVRNLLLASPLGAKTVIGLDPGFRTGVKVAVIDKTGKVVEHVAIYPHTGDDKLAEAKVILAALLQKHEVEAIAIGNGTAGRETEAFVDAFLKEWAEPAGKKVLKVMVSESGASVYSASDVAREEFPDLDLTVRGAISIGRRLQDPLAELVKIDPRSIGVGQYQHDVNQARLKRKLNDVVESCVNLVGVDVNTASKPLLAQVAGIGPALAKRIVQHREKNGPFKARADLRKVAMFGEKAYEQAAGFLRVHDSENPLDNSAVHPEAYPVVEKMAADLGVPTKELVGKAELVAKIDPTKYVDEKVGALTLKDILEELKKPGRDPRSEFSGPIFRSDVNDIKDLKDGMVLDGVVTNVTNFGCFVDIGVHQDGLVHVSEISHKYVKDPLEVVKVGDRVKVKVLAVEGNRKRISLSIKQTQPAPAEAERGPRRGPRGPRPEGAQAQPGGERPRGPRGDRPRGDRGPRPQGGEQRADGAPQGDRGPRPAGDRGPRPGARPGGGGGGRPGGFQRAPKKVGTHGRTEERKRDSIMGAPERGPREKVPKQKGPDTSLGALFGDLLKGIKKDDGSDAKQG